MFSVNRSERRYLHFTNNISEDYISIICKHLETLFLNVEAAEVFFLESVSLSNIRTADGVFPPQDS